VVAHWLHVVNGPSPARLARWLLWSATSPQKRATTSRLWCRAPGAGGAGRPGQPAAHLGPLRDKAGGCDG